MRGPVLNFWRGPSSTFDDIRLITPMHVAAYIEHHPGSPQTIKQHLAAIKMLFDYLVVSQIVPVNPAAPVKGPSHVVKRGKTPVLSVEDARTLLASIPTDSLQGLRDRALIGVMLFSFARVSAVLGMKVSDFYENGRRRWFRLLEKGGKHHEVPVHHKAQDYVAEYLEKAGFEPNKPLFQTFQWMMSQRVTMPSGDSWCDPECVISTASSSFLSMKIPRTESIDSSHETQAQFSGSSSGTTSRTNTLTYRGLPNY
jgi:site-specific recombinase XerD